MRPFRAILAAGLSLLAAGCMQFEYGIALEEDLSGTADMNIEIDLDKIAHMTATLQHAFSGEEGPPTEEEIEAARAELLAELEEDDDFSEESLREEIADDMPEGVELVHAKSSREGLKQRLDIRMAFEHVDRLRDLDLSDADEGEEGQVDAQPFEGLEIKQQGDEIIVRNDPMNPLEETEDMDWVSAETLSQMLEGLGVTFRLTTPFTVVEHNATRAEGNSLVWVFDADSFRGEEPLGIYARLKR